MQRGKDGCERDCNFVTVVERHKFCSDILIVQADVTIGVLDVLMQACLEDKNGPIFARAGERSPQMARGGRQGPQLR